MTSDSMQCLICPGDRTVEVTTKPIPEPGPDDVRIRIRGSAICGSDLHKYRQPQAERDEHGYSKLTLGHEGAGVVDAVGPGVTYPAVGDRVVIYHLIGCGHCEHCRRGEPGFCRDMQGFNWVRDGVNAEYVVVPARSTLPLPDDFDFEDGALLACNLGTAFGAARKARASGDMTLAVSGLGPVGLYTVMMARAMGASVLGIDVQPSRIEMAEKLGIDATRTRPRSIRWRPCGRSAEATGCMRRSIPRATRTRGRRRWKGCVRMAFSWRSGSARRPSTS